MDFDIGELGEWRCTVMDWRFNEFPNEGAHATYITCVEIMGLPGLPHEV